MTAWTFACLPTWPARSESSAIAGPILDTSQFSRAGEMAWQVQACSEFKSMVSTGRDGSAGSHWAASWRCVPCRRACVGGGARSESWPNRHWNQIFGALSLTQRSLAALGELSPAGVDKVLDSHRACPYQQIQGERWCKQSRGGQGLEHQSGCSRQLSARSSRV